MIEIQSLLQVGDELVPFSDFTGPILDEDYIEGAIELTVNRKPILIREQVDYVDQLWAYLITGLEEISEGQAFSTFYPDMPVEITLQPKGNLVTIKVDRKKSVSEATLPIAELRNAMIIAARSFFEKLRPFVSLQKPSYDNYLAKLAKLA
jgi:hypothetical protein